MAVETKERVEGTEQPAAESQGKNGQGEAKQVDHKEPETVSKADYDKLQADLSNFKRIEDERKTKEKKRQEDLLREQGQFKELLDTATKENEAMKTRLEKLDGVMTGMLEEEMKGLPEDFDKTLIPALEPHDQLVWLRKAKIVMVKTSEGRKGDGTPPARGGSPLNTMATIYTHPTSPKH
jgi:hypothetical protein